MGDPAPANNLSRLLRVQRRVRKLARNNAWFAEAIRGAKHQFMALGDRHEKELGEQRDEEKRLARALLERGLVFDPLVLAGAPAAIVPVTGRFPARLVRSAEGYLRDERPPELQAELAAAALAVLDGRAPTTSGKEYSCEVVVALPPTRSEPVNPWSVEPDDLQRLDQQDYLAVALHRLGGLADTGTTRPIVPRPAPTGSASQDLFEEVPWRQRLATTWADSGSKRPSVDPRVLPPEVAVDMLEVILAWGAGRWAAPDGGADLTAAPAGPESRPPNRRDDRPQARPAPVKRMISVLIDVEIATRNLADMVTEALREIRRTDGEFPSVLEAFRWGDTPPSGVGIGERGRIIGEREEAARRLSARHSWWTGRRDRMFYEVEDWRAAIDTARVLIPTVTRWTDRQDLPEIDRWSAELREELQKLGGVIHRGQVGDLPELSDATVEGLREGYAQIRRRTDRLKRVGPETDAGEVLRTAPASLVPPDAAPTSMAASNGVANGGSSGAADDRVWLPAQWYDSATTGALYPDLLRRAQADNRVVGRKRSGRWRYEVESVIAGYPLYSVMLRAALKANQSEPKRTEPKE